MEDKTETKAERPTCTACEERAAARVNGVATIAPCERKFPFTSDLFERMAQAGGLAHNEGRAALFEAVSVLLERCEIYRAELGEGLQVDLLAIAREDMRYPGDETLDWFERQPSRPELAAAAEELRAEMRTARSACAVCGGATVETRLACATCEHKAAKI